MGVLLLRDAEAAALSASVEDGVLQFPQPSTLLLQMYRATRVLERRPYVVIQGHDNCMRRIVVSVPHSYWFPRVLESLTESGAVLQSVQPEACVASAVATEDQAEKAAERILRVCTDC